MSERTLTVDPALNKTGSYVVAHDGDLMLFDQFVDGPAPHQWRDIRRMVDVFSIQQVDVEVTGIGIVFMHGLTELLDVPVIPFRWTDRD